MKFSCDTKTLSDACNNVMRAVSNKSSIPSIEGILMRAEGGMLSLTGYDFEVGINTSMEARVEVDGDIILNARLLCDILKRLPNETVLIESDERQLTMIRSGQTEYSLIGISAEEYPELPSVTGGMPVILDEKLLKNMVHQTIFAVSTSESKPVHTGIKFEINENELRLIAVDGYRLAMRTEPMQYDGTEMAFIVPSKTLSEVVKLLGDGDESISINVGKRHIVFEVKNYSIVSRLLDGEFLDYKSAVPASSTTCAKVNTRVLTQSVERTSLLITDRIKSPIRCIFDENIIKVSSTTVLGRAFDQMEANVTGGRVEIGFNSKYLMDALQASDTDEIRIELNGALSPIKILPLEGERFLFLVLPVRLKNEG